MRAVLYNVAFNLAFEFLRQLARSSQLGGFLEWIVGKCKESENKVDDAFIPLLKAIQVVLTQEADNIITTMEESVRKE